jgi:hypothetical protein
MYFVLVVLRLSTSIKLLFHLSANFTNGGVMTVLVVHPCLHPENPDCLNFFSRK